MTHTPTVRRRWAVPAVLANTSLGGELSAMMAAGASPGGVRSKVKVPAVVSCPDGDTVTVEGRGRDDVVTTL